MRKVMMFMRKRPLFVLLLLIMMSLVGYVYVQAKPAHVQGEFDEENLVLRHPGAPKQSRWGDSDIKELESDADRRLKLIKMQQNDDVERIHENVNAESDVPKNKSAPIAEDILKFPHKGKLLHEIKQNIKSIHGRFEKEDMDLNVPQKDREVDAVKNDKYLKKDNNVLNNREEMDVNNKKDEVIEENAGDGDIVEPKGPNVPGHLKVERLPGKPLQLDAIQPPDHLEGVRLEQDGHLNRDYKKEIFLGNHEEFEQGTKEEVNKKLEDIFHKVDGNLDGYISVKELEEWIILKVQEHFDEATEENTKIFALLDGDNDGFITWNEFHVEFLMAKGHDKENAQKQAEDYETIALQPEEKEQLIRYKFRWADADEDPQDNQLTEEEFKSFRHPEQSTNMLSRMVQDIMDNLDKNHDGIILEEEFSALPPGEVEGEWKDVDRVWQEERRKEFRNVIDIDKNGKVTEAELKTYVDPKNPNHSAQEAHNLIQLADSNKDSKLSLSEIIENSELFLGSKMVNTGKSFHDEF